LIKVLADKIFIYSLFTYLLLINQELIVNNINKLGLWIFLAIPFVKLFIDFKNLIESKNVGEGTVFERWYLVEKKKYKSVSTKRRNTLDIQGGVLFLVLLVLYSFGGHKASESLRYPLILFSIILSVNYYNRFYKFK
jgi:hypothetical protein